MHQPIVGPVPCVTLKHHAQTSRARQPRIRPTAALALSRSSPSHAERAWASSHRRRGCDGMSRTRARERPGRLPRWRWRRVLFADARRRRAAAAAGTATSPFGKAAVGVAAVGVAAMEVAAAGTRLVASSSVEPMAGTKPAAAATRTPPESEHTSKNLT